MDVRHHYIPTALVRHDQNTSHMMMSILATEAHVLPQEVQRGPGVV
jgi:hypothetical protein